MAFFFPPLSSPPLSPLPLTLATCCILGKGASCHGVFPGPSHPSRTTGCGNCYITELIRLKQCGEETDTEQQCGRNQLALDKAGMWCRPAIVLFGERATVLCWPATCDAHEKLLAIPNAELEVASLLLNPGESNHYSTLQQWHKY